MFTIGMALFPASSAFAALAPSIDALVLARAVQGLGAAMVVPLTGAPGRRDRLARAGDEHRRRLRVADPPARHGRHRHGARVRPERERGAALRASGGGRPGLGRDKRDPRARRGDGRGGARSAFSAGGSYASPQAFADGLVAALPIGAAVLARGTVAALFVPGLEREEEGVEVPAEAVALAA